MDPRVEWEYPFLNILMSSRTSYVVSLIDPAVGIYFAQCNTNITCARHSKHDLCCFLINSYFLFSSIRSKLLC